LPVHTLGSWYSEVDPTNKLPVYDEWVLYSLICTNLQQPDVYWLKHNLLTTV
jgi:hypothetical protein